MGIFYYRAVDTAGQIVQGSLEAKNDRGVVQQLHQNRLIPLNISREELVNAKISLWPPQFLRRSNLGDIGQFSQEMAVLLNAGLPLDRSLQIILEITKKPAFRSMIEQIWRDMQAGKSFSEALSRYPIFSPLYISLVKAGEAGGFLEITFLRLGEYLRGVKDLKNHVITALIYPMILALVGGLSIILMLIFVVPKFEVFFQEMGQGLFWSTRILVEMSYLVRTWWWALLFLAGGLGYGIWHLWQSQKGQVWVDRLKLRLPVVGKLSQSLAAAFFAKTLGTLLNNGVPLINALQVVTNTVANRHLSQILSGVLVEVKRGQPLSKLLKKNDIFPDFFLHMVAVGEETGKLSDMLLNASQTEEDKVRSEVKRVVALLEPVLILAMGLLVAFIIVSLLMPILNLYEFSF
jgi:type II secretory pathway component PulF